jgi:N-acetylglucosaminyl-diphospho-decaprenol L-rhamnosyltransferase
MSEPKKREDHKPQSVWIIIVNYRTAALTIESLRALSSQVGDLGGGRVVVFDNSSADRSLEEIRVAIRMENWSGWASVEPLDRNGGFSYGNNFGLRAALGAPDQVEYVMLLNPDTVVRDGAVKALVSFMASHPRVGIAGSRLENSDGVVECSAHTFHSPIGELLGAARIGVLSRLLSRYAVTLPLCNEAHISDWVSGASMIIRRQVIKDIGLMDEGYFLYFEEVDYCRRANSAGWECWYVPESRVMHIEGASTSITYSARRRPAYWYDSRRRYFTMHYGVAGLLLADLLWTVGRLSYLLRRFLHLGAQHPNRDPNSFMFDLLWGDFHSLISGRLSGLAVKK